MPNAAILLLARLLLGMFFIMAGAQKFTAIDGTAGYIASIGLPAPALLAWLAATFEVVAGIAVVVGLQTRIAALLLAAFCVFTGVVFHGSAIAMPDFPQAANDQLTMMNQGMLVKNLMIAGGFLALFASGPGAWSVDARRGAG